MVGGLGASCRVDLLMSASYYTVLGPKIVDALVRWHLTGFDSQR